MVTYILLAEFPKLGCTIILRSIVGHTGLWNCVNYCLNNACTYVLAVAVVIGITSNHSEHTNYSKEHFLFVVTGEIHM